MTALAIIAVVILAAIVLVVVCALKVASDTDDRMGYG